MKVTDRDAVKRIIDHCRNCRFTIRTTDFSAKEFQNMNILKFENNTSKNIDDFIITGSFGGTTYTEAEGRLLEILFHFNLLDEDEELDSDIIGVRSNFIRQPWNRNF